MSLNSCIEDSQEDPFNTDTETVKNAIYEFKEFVCFNNSDIMNSLENFGVAIVPNVLTEAECDEMISGMWDYLEHSSQKWQLPIDRNNSETWKDINSSFGTLHDMLFKHYSVGQAQFIWNLRQNEKILDIFSKIWEVDSQDLLTSFDGASFHLPVDVRKKPKEWLHVDQSYLNSDFQCIQSWVTAYDVNTGDATLSVLKGSHNYHGRFKKTFKVTNPKNWYKLKSKEIDFYLNQGCEQVFIKCPRGSLVLWDSRTVHYGSGPFPTRDTLNTRLVAYICYLPRIGCSNQILNRKQNTFMNLKTTTHYPDIYEEVPDRPSIKTKTTNQEMTKIPMPALSLLGWRLAGFLQSQ